jgi:hypothetical protein
MASVCGQNKKLRSYPAMSIEKKSLISTLKTTKKANAVSSELNAKPSSITSKRELASRREVSAKRAGINSRREMATKRNAITRREMATKRAAQ